MNEKYNDAINHYYELKNKYDTRERKRRSKNQPPLNRCISCKKKGGTIFTMEKNVIKAVCGASSKCKLHIEIELAKYKNIHQEFNQLYSHLEEIKQEIIETKLNLIFNISKKNNINALVEIYNVKHEQITELLKHINESFSDTNEREVLYGLIEEYKNIIEEYIQSNNPLSLRDALELYLNKIVPMQTEFRNKLYKNMYIEKGSNKTNRLIQETNEKKEILIKKGRVISNII